jgi:glycosyltransferase involved in cell wall biosynthesis
MSKRMVIAADATPGRGGQGLNLQHMLQGLRADFDVDVFCRAAFDGVRSHLVPPSQIARTIGKVPVLRRLRDVQTLINTRHFDRYVSSALVDHADLFQGVTGQCVHSMAVAKSRGARVVLDSVTNHIDDFVEQQRRECARFGIRPSISDAHRRRMMREYEQADLIRVMSERSKQTFVSRGVPADRIVVVPPIMDLETFPQATFSESRFRVSFVGLLEPWKGFHYLIEAFRALPDQDAELILWGGSGSRPVAKYLAAQMQADPRIQMRPIEVRKAGLDEVYGRSSVLVHPSLSDGFGYVVAEAMACGIPVITTPNTGGSQLIEEGRNGYIVPSGDVAALSERLAHLAKNRQLLPAMGAAARDAARSLTTDAFRRRYVTRLEALAG